MKHQNVLEDMYLYFIMKTLDDTIPLFVTLAAGLSLHSGVKAYDAESLIPCCQTLKINS